MKLPLWALWALVALPLSSALQPPQVPLQDATDDVDVDVDVDLDVLDIDNLTTSLACALHRSTTDIWATPIDELFTRGADSSENLPQELSQLPPPFRHPSPPPFHRHPPSNKSLYDLILSDPDTTILAKFIRHDQDLTDLLNTTSSNLTFFAPTDHAIRRIHRHYRHHHPHHKDNNDNNNNNRDNHDHDHRSPPKSFIRTILTYHTINGTYSPAELFHTHTLPTTLTSALLTPPNINHNHNHNPLPQRLTIRPTWKGLTLNFYARITSLDHRASNGNLYHLDSVLLPPPPALTLLNLIPTEFSTFTLALYKTGLDKYLNLSSSSSSPPQETNIETGGGGGGGGGGGLTLLIPSNTAFQSTFSKPTTAWLFTSPRGLKYLAALMKYHIVPRETLYSDTLYTRDGEVVEFGLRGWVRVTLPTLLSKYHDDDDDDGREEEGDKEEVIIDVRRFGPYASLRVNGFQRVRVADLVAEEGNGHVLERVLIPPRRVEGRIVEGEEGEEGEIGIEELKGRLVGLVDDENDEDEDEDEDDYMADEWLHWSEL